MRSVARVLAALIVVGVSLTATAQNCAGARDIRIVNGRIHTMDAHDTVRVIRDHPGGLFAAAAGAPDPCLKVIDVHGRTVVPGLIDNHNHIVLLSERPGHDTRLGVGDQYRGGSGRAACAQPWRPGRGLDHGHGRLDSRSACRKAPADPRGTRPGVAWQSGFAVRCIYRSRRHQFHGQGLPRIPRGRGERGGTDRRWPGFTCRNARARRPADPGG